MIYQGPVLMGSVILKDGRTFNNCELVYEDSERSVFLSKDEGLNSGIVWCSKSIIKGVSDCPQLPHILSVIDTQKAQKIANQTAKTRQLQLMRLSGKIDEFGMRLFMSLSKTIPCQWFFELKATEKIGKTQKTSIVVFDEILINPPYRPEDVLPFIDSVGFETIDWVRRIVERERTRLITIREGNQ